MITSILTGFGTLFFSGMFVLGIVVSWVNPDLLSDTGKSKTLLCLLAAVLCAWLGGW